MTCPKSSSELVTDPARSLLSVASPRFPRFPMLSPGQYGFWEAEARRGQGAPCLGRAGWASSSTPPAGVLFLPWGHLWVSREPAQSEMSSVVKAYPTTAEPRAPHRGCVSSKLLLKFSYSWSRRVPGDPLASMVGGLGEERLHFTFFFKGFLEWFCLKNK